MDTGLYDNEQNFEKEDTVQEDNYIKNMNAEIKNGFISTIIFIGRKSLFNTLITTSCNILCFLGFFVNIVFIKELSRVKSLVQRILHL